MYLLRISPDAAKRILGKPCQVSILLCVLAVFILGAQEQAPDSSRIFLTEEEVELADLLDACAAMLEVPLDYERSAVQGKVSVRSGPGLTNEELWALANRWLAASSLACIQASGENALSVVPLGEAAKLARIEKEPALFAKAGFVKVLEELERLAPDKAAEALGKVLTAQGSLIQPLEGRLLIAGQKPHVQEALELLWLLDRAPEEAAVELIPIQNLPATAIVALLERIKAALVQVGDGPTGTLLANPSSSSVIVVAPADEVPRWKSLLERFDEVEASVTRNYVPRRFGLHETAELIEAVVRGGGETAAAPSGFRIVEDELTETLVITASASAHGEIEALLARVEAAEKDPRRTLRAFPLRHRDVEEVLALLEGLLEGAPLPAAPLVDESAPAPAAPEAAAEAVEAAALLEEEPQPHATGGRPPRALSALEIQLAMDPATNRLIAVGPPRSLDELGRLIAELDTQEPQVLIETLIVSLNETQTRSLAVELQKIGEEDGVFWRLASLFSAGSPDPDLGFLPPASGTGGSGVVLDPGSFSGVLRALETINKGRALNVPKMLVGNHETAHLDSVLESPYATSNTSTNLATISFGGTLDAGTTVEVTPDITEGDQLRLDYSISLSTFVGEPSDPTLPPPRQQNSLASIATIPDGYAVVVGGLEIETEGRVESRIPIIGRIPVLGNLFKSQSKTSTKNRFFVFLRASVMRSTSFEDLRHVSAPALASAGIDDGMPVVEPRVIR